METIQKVLFDQILLPCVKEAPSATMVAAGVIALIVLWCAKEVMAPRGY